MAERSASKTSRHPRRWRDRRWRVPNGITPEPKSSALSTRSRKCPGKRLTARSEHLEEARQVHSAEEVASIKRICEKLTLEKHASQDTEDALSKWWRLSGQEPWAQTR